MSGGANNVPTSLVIVGQLGGGLGSGGTTTPSPTHATQNTTWPIAGDSTGAQFTPPSQGPRVQSFATEVPATTPAGEVVQAAGEAIGAYFRTHPPSEERARRLNEMVAKNNRELAGRAFYVGKQNLRERIPRVRREYPGEFRTVAGG